MLPTNHKMTCQFLMTVPVPERSTRTTSVRTPPACLAIRGDNRLVTDTHTTRISPRPSHESLTCFPKGNRSAATSLSGLMLQAGNADRRHEQMTGIADHSARRRPIRLCLASHELSCISRDWLRRSVRLRRSCAPDSARGHRRRRATQRSARRPGPADRNPG